MAYESLLIFPFSHRNQWLESMEKQVWAGIYCDSASGF